MHPIITANDAVNNMWPCTSQPAVGQQSARAWHCLAPWRVYNIGNNQSVELLDYIAAIETALGKKAIKELLPLQPGDVPDTYANVDDLVEQFHYQPATTINDGIQRFVDWYSGYYKA